MKNVGMFLVCVNILLAVEIVLSYPKDVATAFKSSKLVPDVTPCAPNSELQVSYPFANFVYLGKMLTREEIVATPAIEFVGDNSKYHTLVMTDPDVPASNNSRREFRHWIVGNIPGDQVYFGDILVEYINPNPPAGSGIHRYAFMVYVQKRIIKFTEPKQNVTDRSQRFAPINDFVKKYGLGCPVYGNFYRIDAGDK